MKHNLDEEMMSGKLCTSTNVHGPVFESGAGWSCLDVPKLANPDIGRERLLGSCIGRELVTVESNSGNWYLIHDARTKKKNL
jgi:hypothetical protein